MGHRMEFPHDFGHALRWAFAIHRLPYLEAVEKNKVDLPHLMAVASIQPPLVYSAIDSMHKDNQRLTAAACRYMILLSFPTHFATELLKRRLCKSAVTSPLPHPLVRK